MSFHHFTTFMTLGDVVTEMRGDEEAGVTLDKNH